MATYMKVERIMNTERNSWFWYTHFFLFVQHTDLAHVITHQKTIKNSSNNQTFPVLLLLVNSDSRQRKHCKQMDFPSFLRLLRKKLKRGIKIGSSFHKLLGKKQNPESKKPCSSDLNSKRPWFHLKIVKISNPKFTPPLKAKIEKPH